jgi:glutamate--cysteine ligase
VNSSIYDSSTDYLYILESDEAELLADKFNLSQLGLEKESLRIDRNRSISKRMHAVSLGSALCNEYITTDFAEAQTEFVTPPFKLRNELIQFLENTHHFAIHSLEEEYFWPFSMPPSLESNDIVIASYGNSNSAVFKKLYREGLAQKYGKITQAISGIHFNYSFHSNFFKFFEQQLKTLSLREVRNLFYMRTMRNVQRMNWLLLYFFGASPILSSQHPINDKEFSEFRDHLFLPYATSLRMSDVGYQNSQQSVFNISMNSLSEYIYDIRSVTQENIYLQKNYGETKCSFEPRIDKDRLLIEDEYYGVIRPKSSNTENIRSSTKLSKTGIDYLELRSIDIDPYSNIGIKSECVEFLEAFLIFCTLKSSPQISDLNLKESIYNNHIVSKYGRKSGLKLLKGNNELSLRKWAVEVLSEMQIVFETLETDPQIIKYFQKMVDDPDQTPSAKILRSILNSENMPDDHGHKIGNAYREDFLKIQIDNNKNWNILSNKRDTSMDEQKEMELKSEDNFDSFLERYYR